jgi:FKBP-type peptidyl-prolyl cis-trans isomerase FkpA
LRYHDVFLSSLESISMKSRLFALALSIGIAIPVSQSFAQDAVAPFAATQSLQKIDSKVGTGKEALSGSTVSVHYSGWIFDAKAPKQHGTAFDSSVGRGPFSFPLGAGRVIKGWDQGVEGMKIGGKRTLVIPPELGYGARGAGGVIPPNATLIFDVELLEVK